MPGEKVFKALTLLLFLWDGSTSSTPNPYISRIIPKPSMYGIVKYIYIYIEREREINRYDIHLSRLCVILQETCCMGVWDNSMIERETTKPCSQPKLLLMCFALTKLGIYSSFFPATYYSRFEDTRSYVYTRGCEPLGSSNNNLTIQKLSKLVSIL